MGKDTRYYSGWESAERRRQPWTQADDFVLLQSLSAGDTYREIGKRLGRSVAAVQFRAARLRKGEA